MQPSSKRLVTEDKLTQALAGVGGGGGPAIIGVNRISSVGVPLKTEYAGNDYTVIQPVGWYVSGKNKVVADEFAGAEIPLVIQPNPTDAWMGCGFDVTESGMYIVRYSVSGNFVSTVPANVSWRSYDYWNNRPRQGVEPTFPNEQWNLTGSPFYLDTVTAPYWGQAWDPSDGSYYMGISFAHKGVGIALGTWQVHADIFQLAN